MTKSNVLSLVFVAALAGCVSRNDDLFRDGSSATSGESGSAGASAVGHSPPPAEEVCSVGEAKCTDTRHAQTCFDDGKGTRWGEPAVCPDGFACDERGCAAITPECFPVGRRECFPNATVAECTASPNGATVWTITNDCKAKGLAYCDTTSATCRNECGGTTHLVDKPGSLSLSPACGKLVCHGGLAIPDHTACSPPGFPCETSSECLNLDCKVGADQKKRCGGLCATSGGRPRNAVCGRPQALRRVEALATIRSSRERSSDGTPRFDPPALRLVTAPRSPSSSSRS